MTRSSWKTPFSQSHIFKGVYLNYNFEKPIKIWNRNSVIFPLFVYTLPVKTHSQSF